MVTKEDLQKIESLLDENTRLKKEVKLLKASEKAALQSQKDQFEEMDRNIKSLQGIIADSNELKGKNLEKIAEMDKQIQDRIGDNLHLMAKNIKLIQEIEELKKENEWLEANCRTHGHNVVKILNLEDEVSRLKGKIKEAEEKYEELWKVKAGELIEKWSKDNQIE